MSNISKLKKTSSYIYLENKFYELELYFKNAIPEYITRISEIIIIFKDEIILFNNEIEQLKNKIIKFEKFIISANLYHNNCSDDDKLTEKYIKCINFLNLAPLYILQLLDEIKYKENRIKRYNDKLNIWDNKLSNEQLITRVMRFINEQQKIIINDCLTLYNYKSLKMYIDKLEKKSNDIDRIEKIKQLFTISNKIENNKKYIVTRNDIELIDNSINNEIKDIINDYLPNIYLDCSKYYFLFR